jgi:hypothetical protein
MGSSPRRFLRFMRKLQLDRLDQVSSFGGNHDGFSSRKGAKAQRIRVKEIAKGRRMNQFRSIFISSLRLGAFA